MLGKLLGNDEQEEPRERIVRGLVVAVSGTSGGGKTRLVEKTVALLGNAARLHFDDYLYLDNNPVEIQAWLDSGANPDEIKTPQLASDLRKLSAGKAIDLPNNRGVVEPAEFIILEEPFGRSRSDVAPLIDLVAYLDTPEDIALARRTMRAIEELEQPTSEQLLAHIHHDLRTYLLGGRAAYMATNRAASDSADVVLDGMRPTEQLAAELVAEIHRLRAR